MKDSDISYTTTCLTLKPSEHLTNTPPCTQLVLEMLNRLAYETVAQIVDLALLV